MFKIHFSFQKAGGGGVQRNICKEVIFERTAAMRSVYWRWVKQKVLLAEIWQVETVPTELWVYYI